MKAAPIFWARVRLLCWHQQADILLFHSHTRPAGWQWHMSVNLNQPAHFHCCTIGRWFGFTKHGDNMENAKQWNIFWQIWWRFVLITWWPSHIRQAKTTRSSRVSQSKGTTKWKMHEWMTVYWGQQLSFAYSCTTEFYLYTIYNTAICCIHLDLHKSTRYIYI